MEPDDVRVEYVIGRVVYPEFLDHFRMQAGERGKRPAGLTTPLQDAIPPHIRQETSETQHQRNGRSFRRRQDGSGMR